MLDQPITGLLSTKIFKCLHMFVDAQMTYYIQKFNGDSTKPRTMDTVMSIEC
jgi:hypothetical protein